MICIDKIEPGQHEHTDETVASLVGTMREFHGRWLLKVTHAQITTEGVLELEGSNAYAAEETT